MDERSADPRWFWPLICAGAAFLALAASLAALALFNPVETESFADQAGTVEQLLDRFSNPPARDGFDRSDFVMLVVASIAAVVAGTCFGLAVRRR